MEVKEEIYDDISNLILAKESYYEVNIIINV